MIRELPCGQTHHDPKAEEDAWLGPYIRDLTTVHPKSKSEVRRMLEEIIAEAERLERERIREIILQFFLKYNGRASSIMLKDHIISKLSNE